MASVTCAHCAADVDPDQADEHLTEHENDVESGRASNPTKDVARPGSTTSHNPTPPLTAEWRD